MKNSDFILKLIADHNRTYPQHSKLTYKDFEFLKQINQEIIDLGLIALKKIEDGYENAITELFEDLLPYWYNYVPRLDPSSLNTSFYYDSNFYEPKTLNSLRFADAFLKQYKQHPYGYDREENRDMKEFLMTLGSRLRSLDAGEMTMQEVKIELARVDHWCAWIGSFSESHYAEIWENNIDYTILDELVNSEKKKRYNGYLQSYRLALKGYTVEQIANYDPSELIFTDVSAKQLTEAHDLGATVKTVKSFMKMYSHRGRVFNGDVLVELVKVGFTTSKEVRDYAAHFNVNPRESDYFIRVIKAKELYPILPNPLI